MERKTQQNMKLCAGYPSAQIWGSETDWDTPGLAEQWQNLPLCAKFTTHALQNVEFTICSVRSGIVVPPTCDYKITLVKLAKGLDGELFIRSISLGGWMSQRFTDYLQIRCSLRLFDAQILQQFAHSVPSDSWWNIGEIPSSMWWAPPL